jgi:Zn-dependent M28 family amino/carboxypeptidase
VAGVTLRFGHDSPDLPPQDNWTMQSDHGAFHVAGVPFLYFGVEDHPDYHRPTDDADRINPAFYAAAVELILRAVEALDGTR